MKLIDFTNLPLRKKSYSGANGNKLSIILNNELYMLKLPSHAPFNKNLSYTNSCIAEYLECHIFKLIGIKSQESILGKYSYKGVHKIAVACKDFERDGYMLIDFASVKNQIIDSRSNGYGTDIKDIVETIEKQQLIDPLLLSNYFWDMFVVDALIGNWDRHNGNWGFLYNQESDDIKIAPSFDCGSCLFPQIDEKLAKDLLNDAKQINARVFGFPTSAILSNGRRINYYNFIKSHEYRECDEAILRIKGKIDIKKINELIDSIDFLGANYKEFLKIIIKKKFEIIINN